MSEQTVNRRGALMAAASMGALVVSADAQAGDDNSNKLTPPGSPAQFKLTVTLTDGQVFTIVAAEATIEFGPRSQLLVKPTGIMPKSYSGTI